MVLIVTEPPIVVKFMVETVQPGSVAGGITSWVMIGLARSSGTLVDSSDVSLAGVLQEAPPTAAATQPGQTTPAAPLALPTVNAGQPNAVGIGTAALFAVGVGAAAGIVWGLTKKR